MAQLPLCLWAQTFLLCCNQSGFCEACTNCCTWSCGGSECSSVQDNVAAWVPSSWFLPGCVASGTAVGKYSALAPAALKGGGKSPMGFGNTGSQGWLELLPCLSWGQQEGCEHPLWLLPPLHPKALVCAFSVAWQVQVPSMEMGDTHWAAYLWASYIHTDSYVFKA